jgi:hypothetical protein
MEMYCIVAYRRRIDSMVGVRECNIYAGSKLTELMGSNWGTLDVRNLDADRRSY